MDLVKKIPQNIPIIFAPDKNLGRWVEHQTGRELKLWPGSCIVHETFSEEALLKLKLKHQGAEIIAHPECTELLLDYSDFIGSTSKLLTRVQESSKQSFIVLTEPGIIHQMRLKEPQKAFFEVPGIDGCSCNSCPHMRLNTVEKVINSLKTLTPRLELDKEISIKALKPIKRMLEMSN